MVVFCVLDLMYHRHIAYFNFFMGTWFWAESVPVSRRQGGPLAVKGEDVAQGALQWEAFTYLSPAFGKDVCHGSALPAL